MALQARAEATRQKIIDAAVDLFGTAGFGETGLADIISAADVTKGSFYYHFDSKEAVATAIIDKSEDEFRASTIAVLSSPTSPALDDLIRSTFAVISMHSTTPSPASPTSCANHWTRSAPPDLPRTRDARPWSLR